MYFSTPLATDEIGDFGDFFLRGRSRELSFSSSPGLEATPTRQRFDLAVVGSTVIFFVLFAFSSTGCLFRSCATLLDVANGFGAFFAVDFDLWVRACHRWFASDLFLPLSGESTCAILFPRCSRFRLVFSSLSIWICDVVDFLMWNGEPFFPFKSVRWPPSLWVFPHSFRVF